MGAEYMPISETIREDEFTKSINRFRLLSIATREGIWEYDFITKQSFYNDGIMDLFGYSLQEMVDNNSWWPNNVHAEDKKRILSEMDQLLAGKETVWWGKYHFRCKSGDYKLILDRLFVVRNSNNVPLRLIGTMQDLTELDALQEELDNIRKDHRRAIVKAIMLAEENERHTISEELHENINQVLAAIHLHISSAKTQVSGEGLEWLEEAQDLLLNSISGVREISQRLSPLNLRALGLEPAIDELLAESKQKTNINYTLSVDTHITEVPDITIQTIFYRIVQIHLSNIETHSKASNIQVIIKAEGEKLHLGIYDDGMGIDLSTLKYGKGFSIIQERVEAYGGHFNLDSKAGFPGFRMDVIL